MIIFRYLVKEIFSSTFATSLVLMLIFFTNRLAHYLNDAASGKLTVGAVMMVMSLQVPYLLGFLLPLALFLGIMLSFGRLYVDHEMVVLSACGVSKARLVGMVTLIALFVTLVVGWLTLELEPDIFRYRTQIVVRSVVTMTLKKVIPGRFQKLGDDTRVLYVGKVSTGEKKYQDIFVAVRSKVENNSTRPYKWNILTASKVAETAAPNEGTYFAFADGNNYSGIAGQKNFNVVNFDKQFVRQPPVPIVSYEGRYSLLSNTELLKLYFTDRHAEAELQWRITWTLSTLILALLAIPLAEVDPRKGKFSQLLPAILIYVVFLNMMFVGKSWVQDGKVSTWLGMWWIDALLLILTGFLYIKPNRWRRIFRILRGKR